MSLHHGLLLVITQLCNNRMLLLEWTPLVPGILPNQLEIGPIGPNYNKA